MDDSELVSRAREGDRQALEELLESHYSMWYQICRRLMGNEADAADATQEGMVAVVKGLNRFDGRAKFSTWSYRVVVNRCHDELRRRKRQPVPSAIDADLLGPATLRINMAGTGTSDPARQVVTSIDLDEKMGQLSDDFRTILILRDLVGCDYAEMADLLTIPVGTVRSRLARARSKMAELYAKDDEMYGAAGIGSDVSSGNSRTPGNFSTSSNVKPSEL